MVFELRRTRIASATSGGSAAAASDPSAGSAAYIAGVRVGSVIVIILYTLAISTTVLSAPVSLLSFCLCLYLLLCLFAYYTSLLLMYATSFSWE